MADEQQTTLKGKIKILYQLEKWQDVVKLSEQYNEKYGKDVEIDIVRFKSERRLNKIVPADEDKAQVNAPEIHSLNRPGQAGLPQTEVEEEPVILLTKEHEEVQNPAMIVTNESPFADAGQPLQLEMKTEDEPFPKTEELDISDPFADEKSELIHIPYEPYADPDELVITDPFADHGPVFSLASNDPPVILDADGKMENVQPPLPTQDEEMEIVKDPPAESLDTKIAFDFKNNPAMAFDAEPTLGPAPEKEPVAVKTNEAGSASGTESLAQDSVIIDKSAEVWHELIASAAKEKPEEKPRSAGEASNAFMAKPQSRKKTVFNFKYLLILVLTLGVAVVLWLSLSGKLSLGGGTVEEVSPTPVVTRRPPPRRRPTGKIIPVTPVSQVAENEKLVNEKIGRAENFIKNGDALNALALVLEAKKIMMTEPLRQLEERITNKIREDESKAAEQKQAMQNSVQSEEQAYIYAGNENTIAAWQKFIGLYPLGNFAARARNKVLALEKKAEQQADLELQARIAQAKKLTLRSDYLNLNQAELNATLQQLGRPGVQFEKLQRGSEKVIIDFNSGLMWVLWNKPMAFDKASWWANRIYAGYSGWRLPTVEEAQTLQRMDTALYAGLADFAVWTGDSVSDRPRAVWVCKLPQGQFDPEDKSQVFYVWAIRKAVR